MSGTRASGLALARAVVRSELGVSVIHEPPRVTRADVPHAACPYGQNGASTHSATLPAMSNAPKELWPSG